MAPWVIATPIARIVEDDRGGIIITEGSIVADVVPQSPGDGLALTRASEGITAAPSVLKPPALARPMRRCSPAYRAPARQSSRVADRGGPILRPRRPQPQRSSAAATCPRSYRLALRGSCAAKCRSTPSRYRAVGKPRRRRPPAKTPRSEFAAALRHSNAGAVPAPNTP